MIELGKSVSAVLLTGAMLVALLGCQKQEGPAERAGKQVDKAMQSAGQKIEKAGESLQDTAKGNKN